MWRCGANWRSFAKRWVDGREDWGAALVDLRMHGQSQDFAPPHTVQAAAQDLVDFARNLSAPGMLPLALAVRADLAFWTGNWMNAFSDSWNAVSLAQESQQSALLPYALVTMARVESTAGREGRIA